MVFYLHLSYWRQYVERDSIPERSHFRRICVLQDNVTATKESDSMIVDDTVQAMDTMEVNGNFASHNANEVPCADEIRTDYSDISTILISGMALRMVKKYCRHAQKPVKHKQYKYPQCGCIDGTFINASSRMKW